MDFNSKETDVRHAVPVYDISNKTRVDSIALGEALLNEDYTSNIVKMVSKHGENVIMVSDGHSLIELENNSSCLRTLLACSSIWLHRKTTSKVMFRGNDLGTITYFSKNSMTKQVREIFGKEFNYRWYSVKLETIDDKIIADIPSKYMLCIDNQYHTGETLEHFIEKNELGIQLLDEKGNEVTDLSNYSINDKLRYSMSDIEVVFDGTVICHEKYSSRHNLKSWAKSNFYHYFHTDNIDLDCEYVGNKVIVKVKSKYFLKIGNYHYDGNCLDDFVKWKKPYKLIDLNGKEVNEQNIDKYNYKHQLNLICDDKVDIPIYAGRRKMTSEELFEKYSDIISREIVMQPFMHIDLSEMQIFCKTLTGSTLTINIERCALVEKLKQKIGAKLDIDPENQRLIFAGVQLSDGKMLSDCGISRESTIHLCLRLRGGGFADVGKALMLTGKFSSSAPKWRKVNDGINIHGICHNKQCEARKQEVICMTGIYNWSINNNCTCPMCYKKIENRTCGFYKCQWKVDGLKADGTIVNKKWSSTEDEYKYYDDSNIIDWKHLIFSVCKLSENVYNTECPICLESVGGADVTLKCSHKFHKECIDTWLAHTSQGCPLCRH